MTAKKHYDEHLGNFYSWMIGDFDSKKEDFKIFCLENEIVADDLAYAIDLGAGNGIQTMALAELGFKVKAIDFNRQLLEELELRKNQYPIEIINNDIRYFRQHSDPNPELIICCGDTLTHLNSITEIKTLIKDSFDVLKPNGNLILSFRDYSVELYDTDRFIYVKSDEHKILTCFLEYFSDKVRVTDLLHELENNIWIQKISSYYKVRVSRELILEYFKELGFRLKGDFMVNKIITLIGEKPA